MLRSQLFGEPFKLCVSPEFWDYTITEFVNKVENLAVLSFWYLLSMFHIFQMWTGNWSLWTTVSANLHIYIKSRFKQDTLEVTTLRYCKHFSCSSHGQWPCVPKIFSSFSSAGILLLITTWMSHICPDSRNWTFQWSQILGLALFTQPPI